MKTININEENLPSVAYIARDNTSYKSGLYLFTSISLFLLNDTSELSDSQKNIKETKDIKKSELPEIKKTEDKEPEIPVKTIDDIEEGNIDEEDVQTILDFEDQIRRCSNYELIFPLSETYKNYTKFFSEKRYRNQLLWKHLDKALIDTSSMLA